jgi:hypothetical protein
MKKININFPMFFYIKKSNDKYSYSFPNSKTNEYVSSKFSSYNDAFDFFQILINNEKMYHQYHYKVGFNKLEMAKFEIICSPFLSNIIIENKNENIRLITSFENSVYEIVDLLVKSYSYYNKVEFKLDNFMILSLLKKENIMTEPEYSTLNLNEFVFDENKNFVAIIKQNNEYYYLINLNKNFHMVKTLNNQNIYSEKPIIYKKIYNLDKFKKLLKNG